MIWSSLLQLFFKRFRLNSFGNLWENFLGEKTKEEVVKLSFVTLITHQTIRLRHFHTISNNVSNLIKDTQILRKIATEKDNTDEECKRYCYCELKNGLVAAK